MADDFVHMRNIIKLSQGKISMKNPGTWITMLITPVYMGRVGRVEMITKLTVK